MLGSSSVAAFIFASAFVGGRSSIASAVTTTGRWSEAACLVNSAGSGDADVHLHDVLIVGPYILSILVCTVAVSRVKPSFASLFRNG
jgi:hypothetical protein